MKTKMTGKEEYKEEEASGDEDDRRTIKMMQEE